MVKKTLIALTSLLLAASAIAAESHTQHIYLHIKADSIIDSGLLKRMREFKDVEIVAHIEDALDGFYIMAFAMENHHDDVVGYAISVNYTAPLPFYSSLADVVPETGNRSWVRDYLDKERKGKAILLGQHLYTCSLKDLNGTLDEVIADINVEVLEPERKLLQAEHK